MKLYRFLSEDDTSAFCHKVSEALSKGWELHGDPTYAFDAANGVMRCGMIVCQFQLTDVNEGDGGFACIPGSHKANFPCPEVIRTWDEHQEVVYNVPCKAGDMVIFNEATLHGTLPWTAKHERRSLLYRYSPKYLHFAGGFGTGGRWTLKDGLLEVIRTTPLGLVTPTWLRADDNCRKFCKPAKLSSSQALNQAER